ncbi:acyltransferase [Pedobacter frigidisoli]|uniref:Acyltransferase n=1 Tax=Pedobacter frigidisoli TaxID=2530455 RepID=A0A4R0NMU2_9SPHI|nr:acyltransferase [Pedobacter frigidisoli]TCD02200.1 acyltransferase [Pedobacter frigidisoli]
MIKIKKKLNQPFSLPGFLSEKYLPSLDGWRAIAILLVVLGHAKFTVTKETIYYRFTEKFVYAELGVRIFFIISGFLITSLLIKETLLTNRINISHFFIKRVLRIFPLLYLYLSVIGILMVYYKLDLNIHNFLGPILYVSNFTFYNNTWLTGHTWSLSIEEQFYLVWPFVFSAMTKKAWLFCVLIIGLMPMLKVFWYYKGYYIQSLGPFLNGADAIFTGALLSFLCFKGLMKADSNFWGSKSFKIIATLILFLCYFLSHRGMMGKILLPFGGLLTDISVCYLLLSTIIHRKGFFYDILNNPIVTKIGVISYSLYIWQQVFIIPQDYYTAILPRSAFPFNILLSFLAAFISYYGYEVHFLKMKKKFIFIYP